MIKIIFWIAVCAIAAWSNGEFAVLFSKTQDFKYLVFLILGFATSFGGGWMVGTELGRRFFNVKSGQE